MCELLDLSSRCEASQLQSLLLAGLHGSRGSHGKHTYIIGDLFERHALPRGGDELRGGVRDRVFAG